MKKIARANKNKRAKEVEKHKKEEDIIWESEPRSEDKRKKKVN